MPVGPARMAALAAKSAEGKAPWVIPPDAYLEMLAPEMARLRD
jgi:hypothetical protein